MTKAPTPSTAIGALRDHEQQCDSNAPAQILGNTEKSFATLRAQFALQGHRSEDGDDLQS